MGRLLTSEGGTARAACTADGRSTLSAVTPNAGWALDRADPGPALTTSAVFKMSFSTIRMSVTCLAGTPALVVLPL